MRMPRPLTFVTPGVLFALLLLAFSALLPSEPAAGQDYVIEQQLFVPRRFYVGDRVELRLRIESAKRIVPPAELPKAAWISFHEISLHEREGEREVRIAFSSYYPGTQTLPPIDLGGFILSDLKIHTDSVLPKEGAELSGGRGQLLPPGTRLFFGILFAGGALLLLIGLVAGPWSVRRVRGTLVRYREYRPYRRFSRVLQDLAARNDQMDGRTFYIRLLDELRLYLSSRLGEDLRTATSGEIDLILKRGGPDGPEGGDGRDGAFRDDRMRNYLPAVFRRGDAVKFGGAVSLPEQREAELVHLGEALREIERSRSEGRGGSGRGSGRHRRKAAGRTRHAGRSRVNVEL